MILKSTMDLYGTAAGSQSEGSSLINPPHQVTDTPAVRDIARKRLVKTNPDVDAYSEDSQTDSAGFIGKPVVVQDTKYGHYISEHDSSDEAKRASLARPYSRVLHKPEISQTNESRDAARKKLVGDMQCFISQEGGKHCVRSHQTHKNFGCYKSKEQAEKRLAQIHRFK